jgi:hypothetical protein
MPRIVPSPAGYELWSGNYLVCTVQSYAAAREEYNYLLSLMQEAA